MSSTLWIVYARTGREFDVEEQATTLGIQAIVPRRVDIIRRGKRRWPDAIESPFLPNYVFVWMTEEEWHWLKDIPEVCSMMAVGPNETRKVREFIGKSDLAYQERMAEIREAQNAERADHKTRKARFAAVRRLSEYEPGALIDIISGPLQGQMARFRKMVERADELFPKIAADMDLMGRVVPVEIDPLDARKVAAE
jgi:transcription antitermination factor NusG